MNASVKNTKAAGKAGRGVGLPANLTRENGRLRGGLVGASHRATQSRDGLAKPREVLEPTWASKGVPPVSQVLVGLSVSLRSSLVGAASGGCGPRAHGGVDGF